MKANFRGKEHFLVNIAKPLSNIKILLGNLHFVLPLDIHALAFLSGYQHPSLLPNPHFGEIPDVPSNYSAF